MQEGSEDRERRERRLTGDGAVTPTAATGVVCCLFPFNLRSAGFFLSRSGQTHCGSGNLGRFSRCAFAGKKK
ncbi:hypothetical protein HanXRQr2_Chr10g0443911 [Helianthus annuus]|uniref:Uncharacterized protein n=1 Tax=Helianthus annuus TaxID=4232 RepID=A0A9K3N467_HELAN|nr:hypothetical protein HanXRQr2_Chr10g0443911 [Helianthus annuus]KAJ0884017.1 hypothetical protein HanPSC8_Chr10g0428571 [Helianthus annuus]